MDTAVFVDGRVPFIHGTSDAVHKALHRPIAFSDRRRSSHALYTLM
jgi:hypothetical protein